VGGGRQPTKELDAITLVEGRVKCVYVCVCLCMSVCSVRKYAGERRLEALFRGNNGVTNPTPLPHTHTHTSKLCLGSARGHVAANDFYTEFFIRTSPFYSQSQTPQIVRPAVTTGVHWQ
jgi:hypothetical protein